MRTTEEIQAKARDKDWNDIFGTRVGDVIEFLSFNDVREWLKDEATEESWTKAGMPKARDPQTIIGLIRDYMPFAWDKANGCRGLSAGRSIMHMQAWLWMLGADEAVAQIEDYSHYGKPQLKAICEAFGIDWKSLDDGVWRNSESDAGAGPHDRFTLKLPDDIKRAA